MNRLLFQTIVVVAFCGMVFGAESSVFWIPGENQQEFNRFPANPTTNDVITVTIPTDVYANMYEADQTLGGTPTIIIDSSQRIVDLTFEPPLPASPSPPPDDPVSGLQCYFGPLDQGVWTFFTQFPGTIYTDTFNVSAATSTPVISGRVQTFNGLGVSDVTLFFSNGGGVTLTDNSGFYSKIVPSGWSGTVSPFKNGYAFSPSSRSYSNVFSSKPGQDYEATEEQPPPSGNYLTEQFVTGQVFDLQYASITFFPTSDGSSYSFDVERISVLPTNPGGGVYLPMGDDDYRFVKLGGSKTISIFGRTFTGIYVGSNGYITFTEGDTAFAVSLSNYFDLLRAAGLFTDLDPSEFGEISYRQMSDRIAVTWLNVPEHNTNNLNTFQIELFFDGTIRYSYLGIDSQNIIVGLSEGLGVPPDFEETNFASFAPPPPSTGYFTEQFNASHPFDLSYTTILFSPTNESSFYNVSVQRISQLPTNPSGGISLGLGDDDSKFVKLSGSAEVSIYDNIFSGFYVGSNGYITFTQPDQEHVGSLANHFNLLRVSGLFTDLNPSQRGQVTWRQLTDRAVVTWQNVPEYNRNNSNTFQIALYYDGRISISFLGIDAHSAIVGLSQGLGVPPDYKNTIFSDFLTVPPPPPVQTSPVEQFTGGSDSFDLSYMSVTFDPSGSGTSYSATVQQISQLPTNPSGGSNLTLGDDDFAFVKLPGSDIVSIYGNSFTGIYVGSNGYITFTQGDQEYTDSLENQFDTLRVSGLFVDLDPSSGGQVSYKNLNDRVAVTWQNVPEYSSGGPNTFQIELFFNGRIRLSWLTISAVTGIVGLSNGQGIPTDFQETNFSELSSQPPPPVKDYLTEVFSANTNPFDLSYSSVTFTPVSGGSAYVGSLEDITQLPTNPAGGTDLPLSDDNYVLVGLADQARVLIFGQSFPAIFVGSNGYITFTHGDTNHSPTLADEFDTLRVSSLFCDLTASYTGSITARQLNNRVAVTWLDVPEFSNTAPNTFQIEMFFDGRIRLSWLDIGSRNNIVGLSNGLGVPSGFVMTDFSLEYAQP